MSVADDINAACRTVPFRPFTIVLTDQRTFAVADPVRIAVSEDSRYVAIARGTFPLISIAQINGIELEMGSIFGESEPEV